MGTFPPIAPCQLDRSQLWSKVAVPIKRAQNCLMESDSPWGKLSPCPSTFEHKSREHGSVCSRLGRCTALQNRDYQSVPGSGNGHAGKLEGKAEGEKVHLPIKQMQYVLTVGLRKKKSAKRLFIQWLKMPAAGMSKTSPESYSGCMSQWKRWSK